MTDADALVAEMDAERFEGVAEGAARSSADRPGVSWKNGETEITSPLTTATLDPETLLRQHRMDPAEWEIIEAKTGAWNAAGKSRTSDEFFHTTLHQLRVRVRPKRAPVWLVPASYTSPIVRPKPHVPRKGKTRLTLVTTDLQVPFHDERLHELTLRLAEILQPDEWDDLGDVLDLPMLSRHRKKPEFHATLQESLNVGGRIFAERSQAAPNAKKRVLWGNHDARLRNWLIDHAPELYGVTRAQIGFADDERSVLELDYLLRLDQVGWEKAQSPWGSYPYECIWIAPGLAAIHGEHVRKGAGNSVREEVRERDHSTMQGHVNKNAMFTYARTGRPGVPDFTVWGIEVGPMCRVDGSLGFGGQTTDWTRGIAAVTTYDDGTFSPELGAYIDGTLRFRGMRLWHEPNGDVRIEA